MAMGSTVRARVAFSIASNSSIAFIENCKAGCRATGVRLVPLMMAESIRADWLGVLVI